MNKINQRTNIPCDSSGRHTKTSSIPKDHQNDDESVAHEGAFSFLGPKFKIDDTVRIKETGAIGYVKSVSPSLISIWMAGEPQWDTKQFSEGELEVIKYASKEQWLDFLSYAEDGELKLFIHGIPYVWDEVDGLYVEKLRKKLDKSHNQGDVLEDIEKKFGKGKKHEFTPKTSATKKT